MQAQPTPSQPNHGQKRVNEEDEVSCSILAKPTFILNPTKSGEEKEKGIKCQPNRTLHIACIGHSLSRQ